METRTPLPSLRTLTRALALALVLLSTLALTVDAHAADVIADPGGDHGACTDGRWVKSDWLGGDWVWEAGPDWDGAVPAPPTLTVTDEDDGPMAVDWTSTTPVLGVQAKASTQYATFPGGTAGTVTGIDGHAISHIVFCYGQVPPPPPPEVALEKAWLDADGSLVALFRLEESGWTRFDDGAPFVLPDGFDLTVTRGPDTYTIAETVPTGWEPVACPPDAPQPNGLGTFPYEQPGTDVARDVEGPDVVRHVVCNAPAPTPLVPAVDLTKTAQVDTVVFDPSDGDEETVTYDYLVTNTGETPLTGLTLVDDVLGTITLDATDLAVGATTTGSATHVVTAADADAGQIVNEATVTGTAPDQTEVTASDDATVAVSSAPPPTPAGISLEKTAQVTTDGDGDPFVTWDAEAPTDTVIPYLFTVTNTGETPLTGLTLVDDVLGTITLDATDLAVGATTTGSATHVVTAADADAGEVSNVAVVTGLAPDGREVSDTDDELVAVTQVLPLVLVQQQQAAVLADAEEQQAAVVVDTTEELPATGAAATALALAGLGALGLGGALVRSTRRRE